ncbi:MAG: U32 family peptidase [Oxalobacter sp.]|nr:U32 family peptidase [Oxalobacter sp.]
MKLALGPVQYYWQKDRLLAFYEAIAQSPVDIVYLGETVCSRRHEMREEDWLALAERLSVAGKEVVLSTQVLLESGAHLNAMHRIVENGRFMVEANDMGAAGLLEGRGAFVAGPHLNLYNPEALQIVAELGAVRWVMPFEMGHDSLRQMLPGLPGNMQSEVLVYGHLPLAYSARCFTARHHNLQKDDCGFRCMDYPDGLLVQTREGGPFLLFNGIQTQSVKVYNLIQQIPQLEASGVDVVRVSPQSEHTAGIISSFRDVMEQRQSPAEGMAAIQRFMNGEPCNGYWYGKPGMAWQA